MAVVEEGVYPLIFEWALQQCIAIALPVIHVGRLYRVNVYRCLEPFGRGS